MVSCSVYSATDSFAHSSSLSSQTVLSSCYLSIHPLSILRYILYTCLARKLCYGRLPPRGGRVLSYCHNTETSVSFTHVPLCVFWVTFRRVHTRCLRHFSLTFFRRIFPLGILCVHRHPSWGRVKRLHKRRKLCVSLPCFHRIMFLSGYLFVLCSPSCIISAPMCPRPFLLYAVLLLHACPPLFLL